ncbi:hypothetical protein [Streptomyces sp. NPDC057623]|uniref:hypothetical protein n=1 Tax=Streptomyces sp. NPDC057623 TaxID=3346187 RepID=UPI0036C16696
MTGAAVAGLGCAMEEGTSSGGGFGGAEDAVFVPGTNYVSSWREASEVADELNAVLAELGVDVRLVRAVAHVGAHGDPVVWFRLEAGRLIARRLRGASALPASRVVEFQRLVDEREGELRDGAA